MNNFLEPWRRIVHRFEQAKNLLVSLCQYKGHETPDAGLFSESNPLANRFQWFPSPTIKAHPTVDVGWKVRDWPEQLSIYHVKLMKLSWANRERSNIMENEPLKAHLITANNFSSQSAFFFLPKQLNHSAMLINISVIEALWFLLSPFLRVRFESRWQQAALEESGT